MPLLLPHSVRTAEWGIFFGNQKNSITPFPTPQLITAQKIFTTVQNNEANTHYT